MDKNLLTEKDKERLDWKSSDSSYVKHKWVYHLPGVSAKPGFVVAKQNVGVTLYGVKGSE